MGSDDNMKASTPDNLVLFGIGNPLLDIEASVPKEFLDKFGLKPANAILAEDSHKPLYGELVEKYSPVKYVAGGACQNSIRCAQWLLKKPKATAYVGSVGKDSLAEELRKAASKDGVATFYHVEEEVSTGKCAVLITDKERSMVAHLAAAEKYKKTHFDSDAIQALVKKAEVFYVTSFFLTVSPDTLVAIGEHCNANNKPFLMNLSAPFLINFFWDKMEKMLPYIDFIFCNEVEATEFGKKQGWGEDLKVVAQKLEAMPKNNKKRPRLVCFTQGPKPAIVAYQGKVTTFAPTALADDKIVDLNGAGDAYVGGFLARYIAFRKDDVLSEKQVTECMDAARYSAFEIIQVSGTTLDKEPKHKYDF